MNDSKTVVVERRVCAAVLAAMVVLLAGGVAWGQRTAPATFYVDSDKGDDKAAGTSEAAAWRTLERVNSAELIGGDTVRFACGRVWRGQLKPHSGSEKARITYTSCGQGPKPIIQGSLEQSQADQWEQTVAGIWATVGGRGQPLEADVGILILDHGAKWGVKKWSLADLKAPLDYWYDAASKRVFVACDANPASRFKSIELALTRHIVNQGGVHDVTYDGLAVRYGAAHGFGGGSTARITIRNCEIYWIGGGLQYVKPGHGPVRFGNGIEFWSAAHDHLVEYNRLWEIYDAALTNQGRGDNSKEINVIWRHNVIWNAEYSFEFWNGPASAVTRNIVFEHNTCVDAGCGWAHAQRPNPNGAHLMFYNNPSATKDFVVRNNIFANSSEVCLRMDNDWRAGLTMSNNLYWQTDKPVVRWLVKQHFTAGAFGEYQAKTGMDRSSQLAQPLFRDAAGRDYRLRADSPGAKLADDGQAVGARTEK